MRRFIQAHRRTILVSGGVLTGFLLFVVIWFQPQKLFIEQNVDEAPPQVEASHDPSEDEGKRAQADEVEVIAQGTFQGLEHHTIGEAKIIELAGGNLFLRFENLETSNGPDLRVYLSEIPASDDWHAYGERFIDLGALKGNRGSQNYEIPLGTDPSKYRSAVIWCRRFTVGFGVAGLR